MAPRRRARPARASGARWALVLVLLGLGALLLRGALGDPPGPPQPHSDGGRSTVSASGHRQSPAASPGADETAGPLPASPPTRVAAPAIGLDVPVRPVGLDVEGFIEPPPAQTDLAGWLQSSPTPGERGASVLAGHVDSDRGPAVFYGLGALRKGHRVEVTRDDGTTAVFRIYGVEVHAHDAFPAERVYAGTARPELRLLTCGGSYDAAAGYRGNVVVFARLVTAR
ncbi:class F sortase [Streptomyces sp. JJ36]|uniref:class F sortase n=1 Tax=Streptomyces sp. JJ36 TaxID=2736645 RepID=UPI001F3BE094|nr:class F sortase [Streptomyces sp. JJ36]MCF6524567.1 class F sortase [Streptomyces sp. JJ36]